MKPAVVNTILILAMTASGILFQHSFSKTKTEIDHFHTCLDSIKKILPANSNLFLKDFTPEPPNIFYLRNVLAPLTIQRSEEGFEDTVLVIIQKEDSVALNPFLSPSRNLIYKTEYGNNAILLTVKNPVHAEE